MSDSEVSRPSEKRTRELASAGGTPIAERTCEGVMEPEEQAEPLLAHMPSRSKAERRAMESVPETEKAMVFGSRK